MNFLKKIFKIDPEVDYQHALREDMRGNYEKAFWLFEKAAQHGLTKAQFQCGFMCLKARGTEKNISKAFELINKAASQDYYKAQYLLSQMYLFGIGTKKNKDEADNLMQKAKQRHEDMSKLSFLNLWEE
jgi:TPR repeat protein